MLAKFLHRLLKANRYQIDQVRDGVEVLERVRAGTDLLLLDLNLPSIDGIEILRQLRQEFPRLPVLVLTARTRDDGTLLALESGADDCLTKPFSHVELLARMKALLRRTKEPKVNVTQCADLFLCREQMKVTRGDRKISLSQREFALLEYLMRTPRAPVPRAVLLEKIWGSGCEPSTNIVDVYMKYVRDKVDMTGLPKLIHTIRGVGYMVSDDAA